MLLKILVFAILVICSSRKPRLLVRNITFRYLSDNCTRNQINEEVRKIIEGAETVDVEVDSVIDVRNPRRIINHAPY